MKIILAIVFLLLFINKNFGQSSYCSFSGNVYEADTKKELGLGYVIVESLNIIKSINEDGFFKIDSIPIGKYKIKIRNLGYLEILDTLIFYKDKNNYHKDYYVLFPVINYEVKKLKEYEIYHDNLRKSADDKSIINFIIDDFEYEKGTIHFYPKFVNNTEWPVYILEEKECINPLVISVFNSNNEKIQRNVISLECDTRMFYNPDTSDLIKIEPNSTYDYKKSEVELYDFSRMPKDEYTIEIFYEFYKPMLLRIYRTDDIEKYSSEIKAARIGLRGKYQANKKIVFKN
ncbi:MAG: carboxypeptidase-like regulatory domain-containing protein [Melioribacteraceae bacterium]|nr:MAG: carboxypeptidase-like regulatory domain-containing protein [Melioribacteraceae bacterium]